MIKSYAFELMDTKMYVIDDGKEAVVIDPFECSEVISDLSTRDKVYILLTHEHFDHISGVNAFRERLSQDILSVFCSKKCNDIMSTDKNNTRRFPLLFLKDRDLFHYVKENYKFPYICSADSIFDDKLSLEAAGHDFEIISMPGHSPGSSIIIMDNDILFGGDNILGNRNEISFPDSDKEYYENVILHFLNNYNNQEAMVYPGHG